MQKKLKSKKLKIEIKNPVNYGYLKGAHQYYGEPERNAFPLFHACSRVASRHPNRAFRPWR
jgi:hypothetical protein